MFLRWILVGWVGCGPVLVGETGADVDGDGFVAEADGGADCDDLDASVNPDSAEVCGDQVDNNCDGAVDDAGLGEIVAFPDVDGDGYGDSAKERSACPEAVASQELVTEGGDCNDADAEVHPGQSVDVCDRVDNDCDGALDEDGAITVGDQAFDSLVEAVASATTVEVSVCPPPEGWEIAPLTIRQGEVTIRGFGDPVDNVLISESGGALVVAEGSAVVVLERLTFTGASSTSAVEVGDLASLTLETVVLRGNEGGGAPG